ncbi:MAG TPA: GNAT family protein [Acidimicrobiales bacterium]|nr:GNAT family protein [Acidimicrobiales bacterium]
MNRHRPVLLEVTRPIRTARLVLRPFRRDDLPDLLAIESDPGVARYLYRGVRDEARAAQSLETKMRATRIRPDGGALSLAVVLGDHGPVVGDLTLTYRSPVHRQAEIGYALAPAYHGHGLATEAAAAAVDLAFDGLRAHRVYARIDPRNRASARVLEKLGMRREAHLVESERVKGEWTDEVVYALLHREWAARRRGDGRP